MSKLQVSMRTFTGTYEPLRANTEWYSVQGTPTSDHRLVIQYLTAAVSDRVSLVDLIQINIMLWHSFSTKFKQGNWIRKTDWSIWFKFFVWALKLESDKRIYRVLFKRIHEMYIQQGLGRRNLRFVYTYLKECYTVTLSSISGNCYSPSIRVRLGKAGLPLIIPSPLRILVLKKDRRACVSVLTLLAIHRILPWWPLVNLATILDAFNGIIKTLSQESLSLARERLCLLAGYRNPVLFRVRGIRPLELRSSSPNHSISVEGCIFDAFAFIDNPLYFLTWCYWCFSIRSYWPLLSILVINICGLPIYFYLKYKGKSFHIGKLTAVYNVAGKSRIVGITNYWVQIALFPLHKSIFSFLKKLKTDGTFDQTAPLDILSKDKREYRSYDLSAATDRLPLQLQVDVLSTYIGKSLASTWQKMISFPLITPNGDFVKYSVGQPMGAYSSWAMLALTHHTIVQVSSDSLNENYAVLGDDVVVDEFCGEKYATIMQQLGVSISYAKSIISKDYVEFAKKLRTIEGADYSVIGPGLILAAVRNRLYGFFVFADVLLKGLADRWDAPRRLEEMPLIKETDLAFGFMALFGVNGLVDKIHMFAPQSGKVWYYLTTWTQSPTQLLIISVNLLKVLRDKYQLSNELATKDLNRIWSIYWHIWRGPFFLRILHTLLLFISPLLACSLSKGIIFETPRPRYPHCETINEMVLELYSQLDDLKINSSESFLSKDADTMLKTFRRIYPPLGISTDVQDGYDPTIM